MEGFPSGQREQTVNLSSMTSVVRIHHLPPKQKDIPKGMSFFCFGGRWLWIRKVALRNSPVGCFNHRGFRRNGSESTTGRVGTRVAVRLWDCTSQLRQARARSEGKNRLCSIAKSTCTGYLERYIAVCDVIPSGRKIIRFVGEHSDSLRAAYGGCSLDAHCGGCLNSPFGIREK